MSPASPPPRFTRRPGYGLEQRYYCDESIFALDVGRIFHRRWLFAGFTCQVRNPGDYFLFPAGADSLIVVRDHDGGINALFNTCRHRGSVLCTQAAGRVSKLVCPYHQWAYSTAGELVSARLMGADFDRAQFPLHRAHVEVVCGLIYVCLAETPPDFGPARAVLEQFIAPHGAERAKVAVVHEYDVQANWKLLFENNRECYHCAVGHPEFCRSNYDVGMPGDRRRDEHYEELFRGRKAYWETHGLAVGPVNFPDGQWFRCARLPLREGFVTESLDGQPVGPVMGDLSIRDAGSLRVINFPNTWFHFNSDNINATQLFPVSATRSRARLTWLVDEKAVEHVDYEADRVAGLWKITTEQDWELCEFNQRGIASSRYEPGRYSDTVEAGVELFVDWYLEELNRAAAPSPQHGGRFEGAHVPSCPSSPVDALP